MNSNLLADVKTEIPESYETTERKKSWPKLDNAALYGLSGDVVDSVSEINKEIDPAATLTTFLTYAGALFGNKARFQISHTGHYSRLFVGIVGRSARARKGTSLGPIKAMRPVQNHNLQLIYSSLNRGGSCVYHPGRYPVAKV